MKRLFQRLFRSASPRPFRSARSLPGLEQLEDRVVPAATLTIVDAPTGIFPQFTFVDPHPNAGGEFGKIVMPLSTGNVVVTDPNDDAGGASNAGAVYLFNGTTGALITTLTGSSANDFVGVAITALTNGNFVVNSTFWSNGANLNVGAVTWVNGTDGLNGVVSTDNSLHGTTAGDQVGNQTVMALPSGNYLVRTATWDNETAVDAGAVTFGNGAGGTVGPVSATNSLVGSTTNDMVGAATTANIVIVLPSGNYVVRTSNWDDGATANVGAVTWGSGMTGIVGPISAANSLVGSTSNDNVGSGGVVMLSNGNYAVLSPSWDNGAADVGAVTWVNGTTGQSATSFGPVSLANSLVGTAASDNVGGGTGGGVTPLTNGNYVIRSPQWDNGTINTAGAATWVNGTTGQSATSFGAVSIDNSIVGTTASDGVSRGGVALSNGNFVIFTSTWRNNSVVAAGAVTWGDGATGMSVTGFGAVSAANSLVGTTTNDAVGNGLLTPLTNGNYVVASPGWDDVDNSIGDAGAVTWGNGLGGTVGSVSAANSLVGSTASDRVGGSAGGGTGGVTRLMNGNYVVRSPSWDGAATNVGAVTWGNGLGGTVGTLSASNSLVGSTANDQVGGTSLTALTNGNYVVVSTGWDNDSVSDAGAVTWGNGTGGTVGTLSASNSLVGPRASDTVGNDGVIALTNGNYVVRSRFWDNDSAAEAGAVTWGNGASGTVGAVSPMNSLVGSTFNDVVGRVTGGVGGVVELSDGSYVVRSEFWDNGATADAGAASWVNGFTGLPLGELGALTTQNSILGQSANAGSGAGVVVGPDGTFFARFPADASGGQVVVGLPDVNLLTFDRGGDQSISVTPQAVAVKLSAGISVTLQATAALSLNSALTVDNPNGLGGDLTLESQDRLTLSANVSTDGVLTLKGPDMRTGAVLNLDALELGIGPGAFDLGGPGAASFTNVASGLVFDAMLDYRVDINGNAEGDTYDYLAVSGDVELSGADLVLTFAYAPQAGDSFKLIELTGGGSVGGTFADLPEGAVITTAGAPLRLSYVGGDGNDVTLTAVDVPLSLVVDNTGDVSDGDFSAGQQTLREAIERANLLPDANTISFDETVFATPQTITLGGTQLPTITADLTLIGPGAQVLTVSGNTMSRVFDVAANVEVELVALTVADGNAMDGSGGGLRNLGTTTATGTVFRNNRANSGGGIGSEGILFVVSSTITGNSADAEFGFGGGIGSFGPLTIVNSTVSGNQSQFAGGGIYSTGSLLIRNATITNNRADADGVDSGFAGGVGQDPESGNRAVLHNTIVAGNFLGTGTTPNDLSDASTNRFFAGSHNLIGSAATSAGLRDGVDGNLVGVNGAGVRDVATILDTTLRDNGGATLTHALVFGSVAQNAGDRNEALDIDGTFLNLDQRADRQFRRVQFGQVDIGAFESDLAPPTPVVLSIAPVTQAEGDSGTTAFQFVVAIDRALNADLTFDFTTRDGSAQAGSDYTTASGQGRITAGNTSTTITVQVNGDRSLENPETFTVELTNFAGFPVQVALENRAVTSTALGQLAGPSADRLQVVGTTAYIANGAAGLQVIDVSDPTNPALLGAFDPSTSTAVADLDVAGSVAYLALRGLGVVAVDVGNPSAPAQLGSLAGLGNVFAVDAVTNKLYAGTSGGVVHVLDVTAPTTPVLLGSVGALPTILKLQVVGTLAYLATDGGLRVIDVEFEANPALIGSLDLGTAIRDVKVVGTLAYTVSDTTGLIVIDVSDPTAPVRLGTYESPFNPVTVDVTGATAFLGSFGGVEVLDVSNPANPALLTTLDFSAFSVSLEGRTGYFGSLGALRVEDVQLLTNAAGTIANDDMLVVDNLGDVNDDNFTAGNLTLREAIDLANGFAGGNTITFDPTVFAVPQTITLIEPALPTITDDLTILGSAAGVTIDANQLGRILTINAGQSVVLSNLTLRNGRVSDNGGGLLNDGALTLLNSTLAGNTSVDGQGGGVANFGSLLAINSTISGNTAENGTGGGIFNVGTLTVVNSTIAFNSALLSAGGLTNLTSATLRNTLVVGNTNGNVFGNEVSGSNNLLEGDAATILDAVLSANGGPTPTHALLAGSPARDAGSDALARDADSVPLAFDQRGPGFPRFIGTVDIGAFEAPAVASAMLSPDPLNPGKMALMVEGDGNANTIRIQRKGDGRVEVMIDGESLGRFRPTGRIVVEGGDGDDDIRVSGSKRSAWVYGGAGNDTLITGAGQDVVVGGAGDDTLQGGRGRDILIGGTGRDTLKGQKAQDILVAGFTLYDDRSLVSEQALAAIAAVWTGDGGFRERVEQVRDTGVGSGNRVRLNTTTVGDDGVSDELRGRISNPQAAPDWFLADRDDQAPDTLLGVRSRDTVTDIDVLEG